ncbi:hypothetical protein ABL840_04775 [Variovorax sp. NFACC27]|jgi:hypothetical protein|uniref:Uncharacterized protein n=1 Tax=Variovorax paradoxus TaxID=34073 RepID=A0A5Q0LXH0_VARPD|nr:hypothetical protein [Variovorax paradoxus]SEF19360.1 hypothetical protein SAMN03159371_00092 [Variovorax sp. NFACC28]SEF73443.1 hypothetical protein SAMN03159365_00725 [Variovorax sp. NFACC29]SFB77772.1 hypothetical protein SAMN03159379_00724 [Variovorax sp. NFACC26]SFG77252.1 hypothetical protein SAMN03159447_04847 [Variovorax sp. NFACC27]QFZ81869.1 hypothetical protein GFK26_03330 [Variovorax paradoxus]
MSGASSTPRTVLVFSVELAVFDEEALERAARARAREDGLSDEVWASMRSGMTDDLVMLLDPGLIADAGFEILQSICEVSEVSEHAIDQR